MKRMNGEEIEIALDDMEGTQKAIKTKYPSLLAANPKEVLGCMSEMINVGVQIAYIIGSNDAWIMPDVQTPGTDDVVDVTVKKETGERILADARYKGGKWTGRAARAGKVIAWRPKPVPYDPDIYANTAKADETN